MSGLETSGNGHERIAAAFVQAREEGRAALMPYMMGCYPDHDTALAVAGAYADSGADLIELGVPFSDPLADGPMIHAAATAALNNGSSLGMVLEVAKEISDRVPVILMVYANMVYGHGLAATADDLAAAGISGVIVPDLPVEEAGKFRVELDRVGIANILLVAPTTPPERRREICHQSGGFVYLVSDTRVTGERAELPPELGDLVDATRADSDLPVAVGFGIGTPEQAAQVGAHADGVIIGSRLVRAVSESDSPSAAGEAVADFITAARAAMKSAPVT